MFNHAILSAALSEPTAELSMRGRHGVRLWKKITRANAGVGKDQEPPARFLTAMRSESRLSVSQERAPQSQRTARGALPTPHAGADNFVRLLRCVIVQRRGIEAPR
jgi:hypothetical protein